MCTYQKKYLVYWNTDLWILSTLNQPTQEGRKEGRKEGLIIITTTTATIYREEKQRNNTKGKTRVTRIPDIITSIKQFKIWFHGLVFLMGGCEDNYDFNERWFLLWSILSKHVFHFGYKGFWMSTPTSEQVFPLICRHGVRSKRHWRPSSFNFNTHFISKRVLMTLYNMHKWSPFWNMLLLS